MKIIAREHELNLLNNQYKKQTSSLVVLYGRRRTGKSYLVDTWAKSKIDNLDNYISIEGLENENSKQQIKVFSHEVLKKLNLSFDLNVLSWNIALDLLTSYIVNNKKDKRKKIIFLDEFQWLCCNRTLLVSLVKNYWDTKWKEHNVMLILCGSITSFMYYQVINSKALYGRVSLEVKMLPFNFKDSLLFLKPHRSMKEGLEYFYVFGGVAKYLTEINTSLSFEKNMNRLIFSAHSLFENEFEKIFSKQFKAPVSYLKIMTALKKRSMTLNEISKFTKISSGGTLNKYLEILELADFVGSYFPINKGDKSKNVKYFISDPFCHFYLSYVAKNRAVVNQKDLKHLFQKIVLPSWKGYGGLAFERLIFKEAALIAKICGFDDEVKLVGKIYPDAQIKTQFDLVYERFDNTLSIFEIKSAEYIDESVIKEFEIKLKQVEGHPFFKGKKIEKGLIVYNEYSAAIPKVGYFHHLLRFSQI
jgi:AAA+ ATPase superfamily predicted ATPase